MGLIRFLDSTGLNPLPAGIGVDVYAFGPNQGALLASDYIGMNGTIDVAVPAFTECVALFTGNEAPLTSAIFTTIGDGGGETAVATYASSSRSPEGFSELINALIPARWSGATRDEAPLAWAMYTGAGAGISMVDQQSQATRSALRLPNAVSGDLDTGLGQYFGTLLPRFTAEPDAAYETRGEANLAVDPPTIPGLQFIVEQFFNGVKSGDPSFRLPGVYVFDTMTDAASSTLVGLNADNHEFAIVLAWPDLDSAYLDISYLDVDAYLNFDQGTSPSERLSVQVNIAKLAGAVPRYFIVTDLAPFGL